MYQIVIVFFPIFVFTGFVLPQLHWDLQHKDWKERGYFTTSCVATTTAPCFRVTQIWMLSLFFFGDPLASQQNSNLEPEEEEPFKNSLHTLPKWLMKMSDSVKKVQSISHSAKRVYKKCPSFHCQQLSPNSLGPHSPQSRIHPSRGGNRISFA